MVLPINPGKSRNNLFSTTRPIFGGGSVAFRTKRDYVSGQRQKSPFDRPLAYSRKAVDVVAWGGYATNELDAGWEPSYTSYDTYCFSKAYERFRGKLYDDAQWGANLAEYRQAHSMFLNAAASLAKGTRHIRRFEFREAARAFSMRGVPKGASRAKTFAANFIEYRFGWEPLFKDIYSTVEIFEKPLKTMHGKGRVSERFTSASTPVISEAPCAGGTRYGYRYSSKTDYDYRFQVSGDCAVTNPNLHLLEQTGLLNPASVLWEVIPFSFVVDWVSNVGNTIRRMSDFAGCTLTNTCHSRTVRWLYNHQYRAWTTGACLYNGINFTVIRGVFHNRQLGLPAAGFAFKPLRLPSSLRLATAWAVFQLVFDGSGRTRR